MVEYGSIRRLIGYRAIASLSWAEALRPYPVDEFYPQAAMAHSMQLQAIEGRLQKALEQPGRSGFQVFLKVKGFGAIEVLPINVHNLTDKTSPLLQLLSPAPLSTLQDLRLSVQQRRVRLVLSTEKTPQLAANV